MKSWREMLLYCLGILFLSKDIEDLRILWSLFHSVLLIVLDEFDYWIEGLIKFYLCFWKLLGGPPKIMGYTCILEWPCCQDQARNTTALPSADWKMQ